MFYLMLCLSIAMLLLVAAVQVFKIDQKPALLKCIRQVSYAVWGIACIVTVMASPASEVQAWGKNPVGVYPAAWLLVAMFLGGVLLNAIVTGGLKTFAWGNLKCEFQDMVDETVADSVAYLTALSNKVEAMYKVLNRMKYGGIKAPQGDLLAECQKALDEYLALQSNKGQVIKVVELSESSLNDIAKQLKLTFREKNELWVNAGKGMVTQTKHGDWAMFVPYRSNQSLILMVVVSKDKIIRAESCLLTVILDRVEECLKCKGSLKISGGRLKRDSQ